MTPKCRSRNECCLNDKQSQYVNLFSLVSGLVRSKLTSVRLAQRARMVLLAADGMQNQDIAQQVGVGRVQVARWRG